MINSNKELPSGIQRLPQKAQSIYRESYNTMYSKHKDESVSSKIAWNVVKQHFKKVDDHWVGKGMSAETYTFNIDTKDDLFIQKADDGNFYIEGTLSDIFPDSDGWSFTEEALIDFANQINNLPIFGGITHQEWQELKMKYSHLPEEEFIEKARNERKGILKTVKAIYEKGKLWIKAIVDKRYVNQIRKFNKMSLEAYVPKQMKEAGKYLGGKILGFALDNNAINPRAEVKHI
jgi:cation transport regulator ChaB